MNTTPHPYIVTDLADGRDYDWTHPDTCPDGDTCEIAARASRLGGWDMAALADGRPEGTYLLGRFGFHGLCLIDEAGHMLLDVEPSTVDPNACRWCGIARRGHGRQWTDQAGWHQWEQPTQDQIKARMLARRAAHH